MFSSTSGVKPRTINTGWRDQGVESVQGAVQAAVQAAVQEAVQEAVQAAVFVAPVSLTARWLRAIHVVVPAPTLLLELNAQGPVKELCAPIMSMEYEQARLGKTKQD